MSIPPNSASSPLRQLTFLRLSAHDLQQRLHVLSGLVDGRAGSVRASTRRSCGEKIHETRFELAAVELEIELLLLRYFIRKGGGGGGREGSCG